MSVILITGASSGIGRALALRAGRAGYDVVAIGRNGVELHAVAAQVASGHGRIVTGIFDVADPANAPAVVALARDSFGRLDVLVNNAGHVAVGPISEQSDDALRAQFGVHVIGALALVREALPLLRTARGHVFWLGSGVARVPIGGLGAYPPAKAAVRSASAVLRRELHPQGIAVTYVDPGAVDTAFMKRAGLPGAPPALLAAPEDVARAILLAVGTRPPVLNAVPWQTAAVALAETFPGITETLLARAPGLVGIDVANAGAAAPVEPAAIPTPLPVSTADASEPAEPASEPPAGGAANGARTAAAESFDDALAPVRRRMERVRMRPAFVHDLLREGAVLDPNEVALQWAGMPNKNERAVTNEVLDALVEARFLARDGESYRVLRVPDP